MHFSLEVFCGWSQRYTFSRTTDTASEKKGFIQSVPKRMKADDSLGTVCVLRIKGVFVEV